MAPVADGFTHEQMTARNRSRTALFHRGNDFGWLARSVASTQSRTRQIRNSTVTSNDVVPTSAKPASLEFVAANAPGARLPQSIRTGIRGLGSRPLPPVE